MKRILLISFVLFVAIVDTLAQESPLGRFQAGVVPGGIFLEWTLVAGQTCQGIQVKRAVGDDLPKEIGAIEGVCGNVEEPEDFEFLDTNPTIGEVNKYSLQLGLNGRTQTIELVYYNFDGFEAVLLQDLVNQSISLVPRRVFSETTQVEILNASGARVDSFFLYSEGPTEHSVAELNDGMYFVRVNRNGRTIFTDRFVTFR